MHIARIFLVSVVAAIVGAMGGSAINGHGLRLDYGTLYYTLLGSFLILATGYGTMRHLRISIINRYLWVVALGTVGGAVMLGIFSLLLGSVVFAALGALYGFITAVAWVALHAFMKTLIGHPTLH